MLRRLVILILALAALAQPAWAAVVQKVVSPGGIEAWLIEDHSNPILAVNVSFEGGSKVETKPGLAQMVASLLDEGAGSLDSQTFQAKAEDMAMHYAFSAGRDRFQASMQSLTSNRAQSFDLFRLALTQPRFDTEPVERVRAQILTMLAQSSQSPEKIASKAFAHLAFPGHPYGVPGQGEVETVKAISVKDIRAFARNWLSREGMNVGVVGDITPQELAPLLDQTLGGLPARHPSISIPDTQPAAPPLTIIPRAIPQSVAVFGAPGLKRNDTDWYAAYLMNYILGGGGFSSWLTEEVREKRGLAYGVATYLNPLNQAALISGQVATQNARMAQSIALIRDQWNRMAETGPSQTELDDAKTYVIGSFALQMDSNASIAALLVSMQNEKLGMDYLDQRAKLFQQVTLEQVRKVARRLLNAKNLSFVVVGEPEGLK